MSNKMFSDITFSDSILVPDHILSIEQIGTYYNRIELLLEQQVSTTDLNAMGELLEEISRQYYIIPKMVASAKFYMEATRKIHYDYVAKKVKSGQISNEFNGLTSPTNLKTYINDKGADITAMYTMCERLNSSLTHRVDSLRSLISKEKEIYKLTMYGNGQQIRN